MKTKFAGLLTGLIVIGGLTWGIAEGVKSTKTNATSAENSAISVSDDKQCEKPMPQCHKHEGMSQEQSAGAEKMASGDQQNQADCPRKEHCPKGKEKSSNDACCKKKSMGAKKSGMTETSESAIAKPADAPKAKQ